jgi:hypothetical protein
MYREHLRRVLGHLKRTLRMEHRLTVEEFNQLVQGSRFEKITFFLPREGDWRAFSFYEVKAIS